MDNSIGRPADIFVEDTPQSIPWLNVILFGLTCLSTTLVGTFLMDQFNHHSAGSFSQFFGSILATPATLANGLPFSIAIMSILMAHEMGHYLTCRYYGISATLPYFIPWFTGTMGAFIRIKSPIPDRASLLEVGIAGPIAGFVVAIPTFVLALMYSRFDAIPPHYFGFGEPLVFKVTAWLMHKTPPPGMGLDLHPIGLAAWFGFFATALNLLPVGQLDGGHVSYALLGRLHGRISQALVVVLIPLGLFYWQGWLIWATVLILLGLGHPAMMDEHAPLQRRHLWLGVIGLAMLILCFTPIPFYIN